MLQLIRIQTAGILADETMMVLAGVLKNVT